MSYLQMGSYAHVVILAGDMGEDLFFYLADDEVWDAFFAPRHGPLHRTILEAGQGLKRFASLLELLQYAEDKQIELIDEHNDIMI